ncbi:hypothetical protein DFJ73DRAFT_756072 [Zopfochytrium polystomum]|nr:hypothetical protein DFJ73DRAFT_756072 [Zopfochytrium polystomum]
MVKFSLSCAAALFALLGATTAAPVEDVVSPTVGSDEWIAANRELAEAARLRFFSQDLPGPGNNQTLTRRATTHIGRWNIATGARSGNNVKLVDCSGPYEDVGGEGRRFYSTGNQGDQSSSICRLHMDGGEWPVFRTDPNDYVIITVTMRGANTVGKNSYFTLREPDCVGTSNICDEVDIEVYKPVGVGWDGAVPNAYKRGRGDNWSNSRFNNVVEPTSNFYAYTIYRHDGFLSVAVSDLNGNRKDIRECAGGSGCPWSPSHLVGGYLGIWDCGHPSATSDYCGKSVSDKAWMVVKEIYWEQYF